MSPSTSTLVYKNELDVEYTFCQQLDKVTIHRVMANICGQMIDVWKSLPQSELDEIEREIFELQREVAGDFEDADFER